MNSDAITSDTIEAAAAAIANARGGRRGAPEIVNVLDILPQKLKAEVLEDAEVALAAAVATARAQERKPYAPKLIGSANLGNTRDGEVTINVPTARCWLQFRPGVSTGTDTTTNPGVGFSLVAYPDSAGEWPVGVIPRDEAHRLYKMLGRIFEAHSFPDA